MEGKEDVNSLGFTSFSYILIFIICRVDFFFKLNIEKKI